MASVEMLANFGKCMLVVLDVLYEAVWSLVLS